MENESGVDIKVRTSEPQPPFSVTAVSEKQVENIEDGSKKNMKNAVIATMQLLMECASSDSDDEIEQIIVDKKIK